ncbi:MAG: helix-turn-helix domain-containing protein [Spirochaetaceae bacterium]
MDQFSLPTHIIEENRLLMDKAGKAAEHYQSATGINCRVMDAQGLFRLDEETEEDGSLVHQSCVLCRSFQQGRTDSDCRELHLHGAFQAERCGGSYIYFCPISLIYWASPIVYEGKTIGSLLAGPVTVISKEEVVEELIRKFPSEEFDKASLREELEAVPFASTERVKSLAELLFMSASWLSGVENEIDTKRESMDLQSRISEEIQEQKRWAAQGFDVPSYPIEKERELLSAIRNAEKQTCRRILNELLGAIFFSSGGKFEIVKFRTLELLVLLSRAAMEGGADPEQSLALNLRYIRDIDNLRDLESLSFWLGKVLNRFINLVFTFREVKHLGAIERAVRYIQLNFTEKVGLAEAAREAGLSEAYFSTIFKEEMKISFSAYVNRLRVSMAKNLLTGTKLSLSIISGRCGFEDQSYFSRIFKKVTGISPGRYRESGGRIPEKRIEITEK